MSFNSPRFFREWSSSDTAATAQLAGQAINALSAANANKKGRRWAEEQYAKQRADALADWHMQNDYNSPAAQMKRYTEAGLNKNLIYGSNQNGPVVRSTDTQSWKPEAPQIDLRGASQSFLQNTNLEMAQAQTDNIKAQNKNILLDSILKAGQINQLGVQTELSSQQLQQFKNLASSQIDQATLNVEKTKADIAQVHANTQYTLNNDERQELVNASSLLEAKERILASKAGRNLTAAQAAQVRELTHNASLDGQLKQADVKLRELNIMPGDPGYVRAGAYIMEGLMNPKGEAHKKVTTWLNSFDKHLPDWLKVNAK